MQTEFVYATLDLNTPFETAHGIRRQVQQLFCRIKSNDLEGYGTALMLSESAAEALKEKAFDMALLDLLAKKKKLSLSEYLQVPLSGPTWSYLTLNSLNSSQLERELDLYKDVPGIKLKLRTEADLELIPLVRRRFIGSLIIDANGCLSLEKVSTLIPLVFKYNINYVEQPFAQNQIAKVAAALRPIQSVLVADEDHRSLEDLDFVASHYGAVNVKLSKYHGIKDALKAIVKSKSLGLKIILGCKTESSLGISAMASLRGLADELDLDGALEIKADPFWGLNLKKEKLILPNEPGLGVQLSTGFLFTNNVLPKGATI